MLIYSTQAHQALLKDAQYTQYLPNQNEHKQYGKDSQAQLNPKESGSFMDIFNMQHVISRQWFIKLKITS
jgi:hypothetical protein